MINTPVNIGKFVRPLTIRPNLVALAMAVTAALGTHSANAIAIYDLVLTENSSSSLTYTYNGPSTFSVTNTSPDHWTIQITSMGSFNTFEQDWAEPEDPTQAFVNVVSHSTQTNPDMFFVSSDLNIIFDSNGATPVAPNDTPVSIGTDGGHPVQLTFNDLAAISEAAGVPETGFTLGLFAFSLMALLGLTRLRLPRPA